MQVAPPPAAIALPEGPGKDVAKRICSSCHSPETWAKQHHTREDWGTIVNRMISKGAEGSDEEFGQVLDYLTTSFGPDSPGATGTPATAPPPSTTPAPKP